MGRHGAGVWHTGHVHWSFLRHVAARIIIQEILKRAEDQEYV